VGIGALGNTDRYDLRAVKLAAAWGWQRRTVRYPLTPCRRPHCRGAIVFGDVCLLCARSAIAGAQSTEPAWAAMLGAATAESK
jgi:hypothetical protein